MYISNKKSTSPVSARVNRFWAVTLVEDETEKEININVESPKLKTYKKFEEIGDNSSMDDIVSILSLILSKNREKREISKDFLLENLELEEMLDIINDFTDWLNDNQKN